jgi:DNA repair exonuclease SbcCD nuclease subunit
MIRGNHDNPESWSKRSYHFCIQLVKDYTVLRIEGKHILFLGGAVSIDRHDSHIVEGVNWWKDEVIQERSNEDLARLATKKIDVVITHSAPTYAYPITSYQNDYYPQLERDVASERTYLQKVYEVLNAEHPIKHWCYGHFHKANTEFIGQTKFQCCDIEAITELR